MWILKDFWSIKLYLSRVVIHWKRINTHKINFDYLQCIIEGREFCNEPVLSGENNVRSDWKKISWYSRIELTIMHTWKMSTNSFSLNILISEQKYKKYKLSSCSQTRICNILHICIILWRITFIIIIYYHFNIIVF